MGERGDKAGRPLVGVLLVAGLVAATGACSNAGGGDGGGDDEGEFSLLSYNVAGLPQEISPEHPAEHIPLISPLLNEYDVVLTQEDFDWWQGAVAELDFVHYHERLRADATHEYRSDQHPGPAAAGLDPATRPLLAGDGNGVLSRLPFTGNTRVAWTGCFGGTDIRDGGAGDCLAMKGFAMVRLTLADGADVDLYTLHAEAGGNAEDQQLQVANFAQLADYVNENSAGRAVIIGGDTNLHTDSDHPDAAGGADTEIWANFLAATGLTDACAATDCPEPSSIDKVAFRDGGGVHLEATSHDMPRERFTAPDGEPLSDHPPVVVQFSWERS